MTPFRGLERDNILRADTTLEKLATLKPAFDRTSGKGTLTAGNSTPLTDGASAVLLASEAWATENGHVPLAYLTHSRVAAVDFVGGEGLLMAPTVAVAELLKATGLKLQDFDFYEIHEAFAAQVLCTLKAWESDEYCTKRLGLPAALGAIDRAKMNVVGSSLAFGHPFAATGARIVATAAKLLAEKGSGRALISNLHRGRHGCCRDCGALSLPNRRQKKAPGAWGTPGADVSGRSGESGAWSCTSPRGRGVKGCVGGRLPVTMIRAACR